MFEPIPEPSMSSDYLKIKENEKHRIRIMGTSKDPATFIQGWEVWGDDNKPHRMPYVLNQPCPKELREIDRDGKPRLFWMFTVWHVDDEKPMVFEVTQTTIKNAILAYAKNPAWGDPSHYVLEIGRTGTALETVYTVIAEPPVEAPAKIILDEMKDSMIDLRVILMNKSDPKANDGNPFGALGFMPSTNGQPSDNQGATNDQVNIKELRDAGEPIPMPKRKPVDDAAETVHSAGSITKDAVETLRAIQDKQQALAPEMEGKVPY